MKGYSRLSIIVLLVVMVAFYVLNFLTPLFTDDYMYRFCFDSTGSANPRLPVRNIADVILSQGHHYFHINGRFVVHGIIQTIMGMMNKDVFNVLNALAFGALAVLLCRKCLGEVKPLGIAGVAAASFVLLPAFDNSMLWLSGAVNYLWTSVVVVAFLMLFEHRRDKELSRISIIVACFCIVAGWTHEAFTLSLTLALWLIYGRDVVRRREGAVMIVAFTFGTMMCAFAPGTISRSPSAVGMGLAAHVTQILTMLLKLRCIYVLVALVLLTRYINGKPFREIIVENRLLLLAATIAMGIFMVAGSDSLRAAYAAELFSLMVAIKLFAGLMVPKKILTGTVGCLCAASAVIYGFVLYYSIQNYNDWSRVTSQLERGTSGVIATNMIEEPSFVESYIQKGLMPVSSEFFFNYSPHFYHHKYIAAMYGLDSVQFVPQHFLEMARTAPHSFDSLQGSRAFPFYALHIHQGVPHKVWYVFRHPGGTAADTTMSVVKKWAVLNTDNQRFLLVDKKQARDTVVSAINWR